MSKIFLIRHAESIANTESKFQGQTYDTGLSELGVKQAEALGQRFANEDLNVIYTSPLKRAVATAQVIKDLHSSPIEVITQMEIIETNHGQWEGKSRQDIEKKWPNLYHLWLTQPAKVEFPGGEKFTQTADRAIRWFQKNSAIPGKFVVISHANIIQAVLTYTKGWNLNRMWEISVDPAAINIIETHSPPRSVILNDTTHLTNLIADLFVHAL